jgi:hypothetical protein
VVEATTDGPLEVHTYRGATVFPIQSRNREPTTLRLGVFSADGRIVRSTVEDRRNGSHLYQPADPARSAQPVETADPEAFYAGVFFHHYGHFLLESLARLWSASAHPGVPIVWVGVDSWTKEPTWREWQREILALLGVTNPARVLTRPERFEVLHVPDVGWRYADWCHPDHVRFLAAYDGPPQDDRTKLWLSRRNALNGVGLVNSAIVERRLEADGWRVVSPERLSIREQLDALAEAGVVAGEEGSAFHSLLLLRELSGKRFHVFRRHSREHLSFHTIGRARGVNQTFHTCRNDAVISAVGRAVTRMAPNAAEILDHLDITVRQPPPRSTTVNHSVRRLSHLAKFVDAQSYLEIGVFDGSTFNDVEITNKDAVDPRFHFDVRAFATPTVRFFEVTSDDFFLHFHNGKRYDLIFIDGLHTFEQTFRDFCASLAATHDRTVWLIDDVFPVDIYSAHPDQKTALRSRHATGNKRKAWHGDVYKVIFAINDFFPNITFRTIKTGGNHQTVAWKSPRKDFRPKFNNLEQISRLTYYDLFDHLDVYRFGTEEEVLDDVAEWAAQVMSS